MKKTIIVSSIVMALGLLIALGPQFLFKVCALHGGVIPLCHWTARAELGMGMVIAALGFCLIIFPDPKTQLGLAISIFLIGIMVLGIPHALIGGCSMKTMSCQKTAFPVLTIEGIILLILSAAMVVYIELKRKTKR